MGNLVKIIGRDIYIHVRKKEESHAFELWYLKEVSDNPNFDNYFTIDCHLRDYPNIWRVRGSIPYNVRRMASQIGSVLAYNSNNNKPLRVEKKI